MSLGTLTRRGPTSSSSARTPRWCCGSATMDAVWAGGRRERNRHARDARARPSRRRQPRDRPGRATWNRGSALRPDARRPVSVPLRTRILLADDHTIVRRGLRMILDTAPDLEVVAEAGDGIEAVARALRDDIDLAILDVAMPRRTGLQAARELSRRRPELRILMLSMHEVEQYFFEALRAGASGCVPRGHARRTVPLSAGGPRDHARLPRAGR
jgi:CheY-like chemotaxis protein